MDCQALRCDLFVTHSLTGVTSISSTISNTSLQQQHRGFLVKKIPHPIDLRSLNARTILLGLLGQIPPGKVKEKVSSPTRSTSLLLPHRRHPLINQYNPCRGSSIGRACGSYNSKEINLKVVGSSPTFGYSYITSSSEQLFFCFLYMAASG